MGVSCIRQVAASDTFVASTNQLTGRLAAIEQTLKAFCDFKIK